MTLHLYLLVSFLCVSHVRVTQGLSGYAFTYAGCSPGQYMDPTSFSCTSCATTSNRVANNASLDVYKQPRGCTCTGGTMVVSRTCDYSMTTTVDCLPDTCSVCSSNQTSSRDRSRCMTCSGSATLAADRSDCGCPSGQVLVESDAAGSALPSKVCLACPARSAVFSVATGVFPGDPYACASCTDPHASVTSAGVCACDAGYTATGVPYIVQGGGRSISCILTAAATSLSGAASSAASISFYDIYASSTVYTPSTLTVTSQLITSYYLAAASACKGYAIGDAPALQGCSALANLCALNLGSPTSQVCAVAATIAGNRKLAARNVPGWYTGFPVLTWGLTLKTLYQDQASLTAGMLYYNPTPSSNAHNTMRFYLASFNINGTFMGLRRLRNQLNYCSTAPAAPAPPWLQFGFGATTSTTCDLLALLTEGTASYTTASLATLALKEPVFYDLYVEDLATDQSLIEGGMDSGGTSTTGTLATVVAAAMAAGILDPTRLPISLLPVPVRITNYRDSVYATPNVNGASWGEGDDVFTGRFTLVDAASSVSTTTGPPTLLRYAADIKLTVTAHDASSSLTTVSTYPPILTITYKERLVGDILKGASTDTLTFSMEYTRATYTGYTNALYGLGISGLFVVVLMTTAAVVSHMRMNARTAAEGVIDLNVVGLWLLELVSHFAPAVFWYMVVLTIYWLVFFKLQNTPFSLLPLNRPGYYDNPYTVLYAFMVTGMVAYSVRIVYLIYRQVNADVFFLDWEKGGDLEGGRLPKVQKDKGNGGILPPANSGISAWRAIFTANEWMALSTDRRIYVGVTLVALVGILEGGGLKYQASPIPDRYNLTPTTHLNRALLFANTQFWYWVVVGIQYCLARFVWEHFFAENPSARFVDLCTVMKVSTLLLDHKYRGFYLHANAPHQYSDAPLHVITRYLHEEACNQRAGRGIPGCPDDHCQTFELHVPYFWRDKYDRVYRKLLDTTASELDAAGLGLEKGLVGGGGGGGAMAMGGIGGGGVASIPSRLARAVERTRQLHQAHGYLGKFLKDFVEESDPEFKRVWKERDIAHATLGIPPDMQTLGAAEAAGRSLGGGLGARGRGDMGGGGSGRGLTHMYTDLRFRFESLVFRGIELDLLCFESLLLCIISDALGGNSALAAAYTYLVSHLLTFARAHYGRRNLSFTTLVDEAFISH